uniref:Kinesin motor domain-containing protein n=1 Tax=Gossypium raimondii TaxID=29730 RepID=A0A0D2SCL5_GOSRA|nr:hypothetical protein B456_005G078400 [Gossypium raimondii]
MQQSNAAATAFYDHAGGGGSFNNAGPAGGDAGDAVMARWLQSAGLQHLASPLTSTGIDQRLLPNLLMQGYGAESTEEKQRLFKLMRNLKFNEFKGDFGAGLLDLHAIDDKELLSESFVSHLLVFAIHGSVVLLLISSSRNIFFISGSGKTFTMQPLPLRAAQDLIRFLHQPVYHSQRFKLSLSYFEIYGGKLFDLLSDRK